MRKRNYKKIIISVGIAVCLTMNSATAFAGTIPFDITSPSDPRSYREPKDDTEQMFYVTGNTFEGDDSMKCWSTQVINKDVTSASVYISIREPAKRAQYGKYAAPGLEYYMWGTTYYTGARVTGWYTP